MDVFSDQVENMIVDGFRLKFNYKSLSNFQLQGDFIHRSWNNIENTFCWWIINSNKVQMYDIHLKKFQQHVSED